MALEQSQPIRGLPLEIMTLKVVVRRREREIGRRFEREVDWLNDFLFGHTGNTESCVAATFPSEKQRRLVAEKEGMMNGTPRLKR